MSIVQHARLYYRRTGDDAENRGDQDGHERGRGVEDKARSSHEERAQREHAPSTDVVGGPSDAEREEDIAEKREREEQTDEALRDVKRSQVEDQDGSDDSKAVSMSTGTSARKERSTRAEERRELTRPCEHISTAARAGHPASSATL